MLRIRIELDDLSATRFAVSPLGETVAGLVTLADPGRHGLQLNWVRWARQQLAEHQPDLALLRAMLPVDRGFPMILAPPPDSRMPTVATELATVRATPSRFVQASLTRIFPAAARDSPVGRLIAAPRRLLPKLAAQLETAHDLLIAPHWQRIVAVLDADIVHRSQIAATAGMAAMLTGLHDRVRWQGSDLLIADNPERPKPVRLDIRPAAGGLVLIPSVFVWPHVWTRSRTPTFTTLRYPARGIGALWEATRPRQDVVLHRLLGRPRATLLALLRSPAGPTELAARLAVTPSAVSQHLSVLHAAGLVSRQRVGRGTLYLLTELGASLLGREPAT